VVVPRLFLSSENIIYPPHMGIVHEWLHTHSEYAYSKVQRHSKALRESVGKAMDGKKSGAGFEASLCL